MNINEVEKKLNVARSNIRFYEKEGLISVKRNENRYRDYTDDDIEKLKLIITLRKLGCTLEEIKSILNDKSQLPLVLEENLARLKKNNEETDSAIEICNEALQSIDNFDTEKYFELLNTEQYHSNFERTIDEFLDWLSSGYAKKFNLEGRKRSYILFIIIACALIFSVIRAIFFTRQGSFYERFTMYILVIVIATIISFCLFLLAKKSPKAFRIIAGIFAIILLVVLIICIFFMIKAFIELISIFI